MNTRSYKIKEKISDAFELPKDITLDIPRITILGADSATVENHKGIMNYSDDHIRINTGCGIITISGQNLAIKSIIQEEIIITGKISNVSF